MRTTETQIDTCRRVADALGFDVRHEFVDEGVSGAGPFRDRLGLQELLAATPELDVIVVDRLDRLSRLGSDLKELMQTFERSRIEVWSVADLPFPALIRTEQVASIGAFAETERAAIVQRMQSGVRRAAESGKWLGGPIPFGYDLDETGALTPSIRLVAGMTEAEIARSIFDRLAAGSSTIKEAQRMNELGIFPGRRYSHKVVRMRRGTWFPSRINAMVRNALYKGTHHIERSSGTIERRVAALVSPDLWSAAQDGIRANRSCEPGRPLTQYLLRGLIRCDDCGCRFAGTWISNARDNWRSSYYRCAGQTGIVEPNAELRCRAKRLPSESIEKLVWTDCARMAQVAETTTDFAERRAIVEKCVRRIGVRTVHAKKPKVALVHVEYANGEDRTFRFVRGDGRVI